MELKRKNQTKKKNIKIGKKWKFTKVENEGYPQPKKKNEGREKYEDAHKLKKEKEKKNEDLNSLWQWIRQNGVGEREMRAS